jgi:hypothetical protein
MNVKNGIDSPGEMLCEPRTEAEIAAVERDIDPYRWM